MRSLLIGAIIVASFGPATAQAYRSVDAADIAVGSRKYYDKDIEISLKCYYADINDYRCVSGQGLAVFAKSIYPAEAKSHVEEHCGELKKVASSPRCQAKVRFRLNERDVSNDITSGYRNRMVISPESVGLEFAKAKRR